MYGYICEKEYIDLWSKFLKDDNEENPYINIEDYTWDRSKVWLDRFMIDKCHQGKGYARPVLGFLINHMKKEYPNEDIYLNVYDDNQVAIKLYREFGFEFTEELDVNGEKIMRVIFNK